MTNHLNNKDFIAIAKLRIIDSPNYNERGALNSYRLKLLVWDSKTPASVEAAQNYVRLFN